MDRRLQTAPIGLLGQFNMKVEGQNPDLFGGRVTPVVDVADNYLLDRSTIIGASGTIAIGAATTTATLQPASPGLLWRVQSLGLALIRNAADVALNGTLSVEITDPTSGNAIGIVTQQFIGLALTVVGGGAVLPHPVLLPPGWLLVARARLTGNATVAMTLVAQAHVQQFEI